MISLTEHERHLLRLIDSIGDRGWARVGDHFDGHFGARLGECDLAARSLERAGLIDTSNPRKPALTADGRWVLSLTY